MNSYRRIVPPGYSVAQLHLRGTSPLLMNSGEVDRDSDEYRAYYMLGQKKRKTLDDEARLRELEWALRLYIDPEIGPYVPGKNVKEMLRSAATKWRRGEDIKRSLIVVPYRIPLQYPGPRDQQGLWDEGFRYTAMVSNAGFGSGRVLRCRPMFRDWTLDTEIAFDPEDLDADFLAVVVERSQKYGLGDFRPEFGSFESSIEGIAFHKNGAKAKAGTEENGDHRSAHDAFVARVMVEAE